MSTENSRATEVREGTPAWIIPAVVILGILAIVGLGMGWTALQHDQQTNQALGTDLKTVKQGAAHDVEQLTQRLVKSEKTSAELQGDLSVVTKRMRITQGELKKARAEAAQIREESTKQITDLNTSVSGQLATKASTEEVKAVSGEVTVVKTDLDATKKDLQMARSELGTLIARNHEEIDTLRRLGERDYIEFAVEGKGKPQKVGTITVELRGTNPKRNVYSVAMVVGDQRVERKNRPVNEPIFFYTRGIKQPLELVVNQIAKDKVAGYLSVPKSAQSPSGN